MIGEMAVVASAVTVPRAKKLLGWTNITVVRDLCLSVAADGLLPEK